MPARGCGDAAQDVVKARENADVAQFGFSSSPHDSARANKLTAFADPDVGLDAAVSWDRAIVNILPRAERRVGPCDNSFVEGEADCGDGNAGKKQGRQYLMRGKSRRFHGRSEEHTSELQSLMRISYAVFCLKKKKTKETTR